MKYYMSDFGKSLNSLLLFLLLSLVSAHVSAWDFIASNSDGVFIYYNFINQSQELEVTNAGGSQGGYLRRYSGSVVIPEEVTYNGHTLKVTRIGNDAFYGCNNIDCVIIPNSVTSIGVGAFYGCI